LLAISVSGFGFPFRRKKYEAPSRKDSAADKVLFAVDQEYREGQLRGRALTLNTLINTTTPASFWRSQAAIAEAGIARAAPRTGQAEAEYKDFILFYPTWRKPDSLIQVARFTTSSWKADRDASQATRAEDECRQVLVQFRTGIQGPGRAKTSGRAGILADKDTAPRFLPSQGSFPAAASRFLYVSVIPAL